MKERKPPRTDEELIQILADLFDEVEPEGPEEIDEALREFGYDPEALATRMRQVAEQAMKKSPLNWRNQAAMLETERARLAVHAPKIRANREDMLASIGQLFARLDESQAQAVAYRNLENASDEDLASLLAELEYLVASQGRRSEKETD